MGSFGHERVQCLVFARGTQTTWRSCREACAIRKEDSRYENGVTPCSNVINDVVVK